MKAVELSEFFVVGIADNYYSDTEESGYSTNGGQTWTDFASFPTGAGSSFMGGTIAASTPQNIIWAPAIEGAFVLTTRGGDFELSIGQDFSIGYLSHSDTAVRLYLQESFTFRPFTSEASVVIAASDTAPA